MQQSVNEEMILEPQEEIRDIQESQRPVDIENKEHIPCHHTQLKVNINNCFSAPDDPFMIAFILIYSPKLFTIQY